MSLRASRSVGRLLRRASKYHYRFRADCTCSDAKLPICDVCTYLSVQTRTPSCSNTIHVLNYHPARIKRAGGNLRSNGKDAHASGARCAATLLIFISAMCMRASEKKIIWPRRADWQRRIFFCM